MIENEVLSLLGKSDDNGEELNKIVDRFRNGCDIQNIEDLLISQNSKLVSIGAWILSELQFELYNSNSILSRLYGLTTHRAPDVRFNALMALFPAFEANKLESKQLLEKLSKDPNDGVRLCAQSAMERLGFGSE